MDLSFTSIMVKWLCGLSGVSGEVQRKHALQSDSQNGELRKGKWERAENEDVKEIHNHDGIIGHGGLNGRILEYSFPLPMNITRTNYCCDGSSSHILSIIRCNWCILVFLLFSLGFPLSFSLSREIEDEETSYQWTEQSSRYSREVRTAGSLCVAVDFCFSQIFARRFEKYITPCCHHFSREYFWHSWSKWSIGYWSSSHRIFSTISMEK